MNDIKYSMIVATNRDIEALKPLFVTTSNETELIIIDSNYNKETKSFLKSQTGYKQIVYAPVKESTIHLKRDFSQALNTALLYAEGDWIIRADDNLEFHQEFFKTIEEDINYFSSYMDKFVVIGRKLWGALGEERWVDNPNFSNRYSQVSNPKFTFSFGIFPRNAMKILNGYEETFDMGFGGEDEDFLLRLLVMGFQVYFDKNLLAFSHSHSQGRFDLDFTDKVYEIQKIGIENGKVHAYNNFGYEKENIRYIRDEKRKWLISV